MSSLETRRFTLADFRTLPEITPPLEYFGRRVVQKMSPKLPHSVIQTELSTTLVLHNRATRQGRVYNELRCTFGGASHVFDLCLFVADRLPDPTNPADRDEVLIPPDLAIEILSPGQTVGELTRKLRSAVRRGVRLGWLIDEARRRVHVLHPNTKPLFLHPGDVLTGEPVLSGFRLPIAELFSWVGGPTQLPG